MATSLALPKLVFRHVLCRLGLLDAYVALRLPAGRVVERRPGQGLDDVFSQIYARGLWVEADGQDSLSGSGSTRQATHGLADRLSAFLAEVNCRHLVDVGCGDANWVSGVEGTFDYLGLDVVPQVIARNERLHGGPGRRFACLDATREPIPPGDVALCREVLFHLSFKDGMGLLANLRRAGFRHVVLTQDAATVFNADITSGGFRTLDLTRGPFRLPPPERVLADDGGSQGRVLGVWPAAVLPG